MTVDGERRMVNGFNSKLALMDFYAMFIEIPLIPLF